MKKLHIISLLFLLFSINTFSQIERIEPPFWWTGFKNQNLQIMVYGENITQYTPSINHNNITLKQTIEVENPNYLFLDVLISDNCKSGFFDIIFTSNNKKKFTYSYELKSREKGSAQREGFNSSDVIYLITPDRFANGNPQNDDIKTMRDHSGRDDIGGRHGGDILGISQHLDYIKDMGFTSLWITPMIENDMKRNSYHGYAMTDFYKTDPRMGSNESYIELCEKAKNLGIKMIMDMVFNHCGVEHWWMNDLPTSDWINNKGEFLQCNHRRNVHQDTHVSKYDKIEMSDGWFVEDMPDLNQRNPLVANYLTQNSIWWIEYAGLCGIRMDTWPYPDPDMMAKWSCRIMDEYPDFNIVGEEWSPNPAITSYWQAEKINENSFQTCLRSLMDFPVQIALIKALTNEETWGTGWLELYEIVANDFQYPNPNDLVIFADNHDMNRFMKQVNQNTNLVKMGMAFILTMRGIPQIYYGTEVLLNNPKSDDHGEIRKDFPGGWNGDKSDGFTGEGLSEKEKSVQDYIKKIANWRKNSDVIHNGNLMHFAPFDGIYSYFRYDEKEMVLVILNKNKSEIEISTNRYQEILKGAKSGKNILDDREISLENNIKVAAESALIIEIY